MERYRVARLESYTTFTLLGIRFWDQALDSQISDGLVVTARPETGHGKMVRAVQTCDGIYAFRWLAGMRDYEYPSGDEIELQSPLDSRNFIVEVFDTLGRFLPVTTSAAVPERGGGLLFTGDIIGPPAGGPPGFYLFSAPTRRGPSGFASIRGQLWNRTEDAPAAWAVVEVEVGNSGGIWYGMTDDRGCVAVIFPYPAITGAPADSSPPAAGVPLHAQTWQLTLRVRYGPADLETPAGARAPLLGGILSQSAGVFWPTRHSRHDHLDLSLRFGQDLILRTEGESRLLIDAATSPP